MAATEASGPGPLLVALAVAAGGSLPQIGAFARARWTALLPDASSLRTALAVESLIDEAVFIVGPVVVTLLATTVAPAAGLLAAIGLAVVGCLLFVAQRRTRPRPQLGDVLGDRARAGGVAAVRHRGLTVIVAVFLGIGAVFGLIEVSVVALARDHGQAGAAGPMLGLWASGSLLAGIAYGAIAWTAPAPRRFLVTVAAFALGTVLIAAGTQLAGGHDRRALRRGGRANALTLITGNTLVPAVVPRNALTEAYTWLSVTLFAGIAVGSALAGALVDRSGPVGGLLAATAAAGCAVLGTVIGYPSLAPPRTRSRV